MSQLTILVVEDHEALRETIAYNLRGEDYFVLTASDGVQALDIAQHNPISLILLDLMLPRLNGLDVCRRLRARRETAQTPILVLTARSDETEKVVALEVGADDFVTKPFNWLELRSRIRALLRRSVTQSVSAISDGQSGRGDESRIITIGDDLTLDVDGHTLTRQGRFIEIKKKMFDLLVYMARYRGIVLSRDRLLQHVWGYEYDGDIRTVDVHIRWLREKIEIDPNHPQIIQTVRGVGYRLAALSRVELN